ncbi:MAG: hypothetical protein ACRD44_04905, partial [Bryobacteraceae bacterium]
MSRRRLIFLCLPVLAAQVPDHYIVELTGEPALVTTTPGKGLPRQAAADGLRRVAAEQDRMRAALASLNAEVLDAVQWVGNGLIVRVAGDRAAGLEALPGVRRVHAVYELRPHLNRALALHRVPDGWVRA